jgi:hypothetical protein
MLRNIEKMLLIEYNSKIWKHVKYCSPNFLNRQFHLLPLLGCMISRALCLMILVIISSFPIVNTLQVPPKAMPDDVIQALKVNDTEKAQVHLSILNQQLPSFANPSSVQSVKVLLEDVTSALNSGDVNKAMVHLNLIKQQFVNTTNNACTYN